MTTLNEDILRKIKKCLALASSDVPGEAEAAMRQAQKLMALHGVTEGGLARADITSKMLQGTRGINPTPWETRLAQMCCRAFGAKLLWIKGPKGGRTNADNGWWKFVAPKSQVELVVYTFTVLSRQVLNARSRFVLTLDYSFTRMRKAAEADAFCEAFVAQLSRKVSDAMLDPKVKAALEEHYTSLLTPNKPPVTPKNNGQGSWTSAMLGAEEGQRAHFHAATTGAQKLKQLGRS